MPPTGTCAHAAARLYAYVSKEEMMLLRHRAPIDWFSRRLKSSLFLFPLFLFWMPPPAFEAKPLLLAMLEWDCSRDIIWLIMLQRACQRAKALMSWCRVKRCQLGHAARHFILSRMSQWSFNASYRDAFHAHHFLWYLLEFICLYDTPL